MNQDISENFERSTAFSMEEMVNSTPSCLKIINRAGELLHMNAQGLSLIEAQDMSSVFRANVYEIVEESHRGKFQEFNERVCDGEKGTLVFEIIGLNGTRRWMETYAAPYQLDSGEIAHIAITNDISSKVLAEKELIQQRQALASSARLASLGQFVGGIAHEINNPLAIILGNLSLLKIKMDANELDQEYLRNSVGTLLETTERISDIIQNLKTFTRDPKLGGTENYSLNEIVSQTLSLCQENFRLNNIEIQNLINDELVINCRKVQISQVLMNLINNSFDAINELDEKWLRLESKYSENGVKLIVTDSGAGISGAIAEQMFNPFFTTKEVGKGTGLGLSLSARIIDNHGGKLVYNQNSANTQFVIELPV